MIFKSSVFAGTNSAQRWHTLLLREFESRKFVPLYPNFFNGTSDSQSVETSIFRTGQSEIKRRKEKHAESAAAIDRLLIRSDTNDALPPLLNPPAIATLTTLQRFCAAAMPAIILIAENVLELAS